MSDRRAGWALLLVGAAVAAVALLAATLGGDDRSASPGPAATIEQEVELGVVDLGDYCRFLGYTGNAGESCVSGTGRKAVDPAKACDWQYGEHGLAARRTAGAWACVE